MVSDKENRLSFGDVERRVCIPTQERGNEMKLLLVPQHGINISLEDR